MIYLVIGSEAYRGRFFTRTIIASEFTVYPSFDTYDNKEELSAYMESHPGNYALGCSTVSEEWLTDKLFNLVDEIVVEKGYKLSDLENKLVGLDESISKVEPMICVYKEGQPLYYHLNGIALGGKYYDSQIHRWIKSHKKDIKELFYEQS